MKDNLTYKIIGCAMKVHNAMGPGIQEVIYKRCLAIEFERASLNFACEQEQQVYYEDPDSYRDSTQSITQNHHRKF